MSNQTNFFSNPLRDEIVNNIDKLNLPVMQKHHVRLLAHCLEIFKEIIKDDMTLIQEDEVLKEWCYKETTKFNDRNFNQIFYEQMSSTFKKLNSFSQNIGKNLKELDIDDLITLVQKNE